MTTNQFLRTKKIIYFYLVSIIQLNKKIQFFINYLCIVYGIQIQFFYNYFPNWYTLKIANMFLYYKSYLIQITDYLFLIKPLIKDCKNILVGPIVMSIDFVSFKDLRIFLYKKIHFFIKTLSLMFQTFVLQIDEDSEEVLIKIKETDLFRRQKPGRTSFFKNTINEDYNLFQIRFIKRKMYFFIRIIAFLIFPYILYQTNRNLNFGSFISNESKLAFILENKNQMEFDHSFWKNVLIKKNISKCVNTQTNLVDFQFNRLVKSRLANQFRIKKLWDIYINKKNYQINHSKINGYQLLQKMNNLSNDFNHDIIKPNIKLNVFLKTKFHFFNEEEISLLMYKCASWLIQPKMMNYHLFNKINNEFDLNRGSLEFNQYSFFKLKISHLQKNYFETKNSFGKFFINNQNFFIKNTNFIKNNKIEEIVNNFIYHQVFLSKENSNLTIKEYTKNICSILHRNLFLINIVYSNQLVNLVEKYVKNNNSINRHLIWQSFKKYISYIYRDSLHSQIELNYLKSLVHNKKKIFDEKKIGIDSQFDLFHQISKNNPNKIVDVAILNILDIIHSNSKYSDIFAKHAIKHDITLNIVYLYNNIIINPIFTSQKNINNNLIEQYFFNKNLLQNEIYNIFTKQKNKIHNNLYKYYEFKEFDCNQKIYFINQQDTKHIVSNLSKTKIYYNNINEIYSLNKFDFWKTLEYISNNNLEFNSKNQSNHKFDILRSNNLKKNIQNESILINKNDKSQLDLYIKNQTKFLGKYSSWGLTQEGCLFIVNLLSKIFLTLCQNISHYVKFNLIDRKHFKDISEIYDRNNIFNLLKDTKYYVDSLINKKRNKVIDYQSLSQKRNFLYFSSFNYTFFIYINTVITFLSHYWFSFLLGGTSLLLWIFFEKIKCLLYPSWNTELNLLVLQNRKKNKNFLFTSLSNKKDLLKEQYDLSLQKWSIWIRLYISKTIGIFLESIWLKNNDLDLYTDQRDLGLKLIIPETFLLNLSLGDLNENVYKKNNYITLAQEGLVYLKKIINVPMKWYEKENEIYRNKQQVISFSFYKKNNHLLDMYEPSSALNKTYLPISLELSNLHSRAILLIGPEDTGKSYLVKSLATDTNIPIVYFAIDQLIDVLEFEDNALENDSSLYFLRENIIQYYAISYFIDNMDTCIFWIPNLEKIYSSKKFISKTKEQCILLILRLLLKDITQKLITHKKLLFFASCENTSYLDPGFISTKRFDRLINVRIPSNFRRPQVFINFLKRKNINIQIGHEWYEEFSNNTMGFNLRDLACFANQAFLTSLETRSQYFNIDNLRLVLYREIRINKNDNLDHISQRNIEILLYQIGRSIIQTTLVQPNPMVPLQLKYNIWKPRFYYLSKAYLQPNYLESTITQLNILPQILSSLAGLAAIDVHYFFTKKTFNENLINLNVELKHDLDIAINLFESIFKEFAHFDILNIENTTCKFIPKFRQQVPLVNIEKANSVLPPKININKEQLDFSSFNQLDSLEESNQYIIFNVFWSIKTERLHLSRNIIFDLLKKIDEPLSFFSIKRYFNHITYEPNLFEKEKPYSSIYHRSWDIMKPLVTKDLDYYFYNIFMKQRVSIMGLPILSNQLLEYEPPENDLVFIQNRPVWNPAAISSRNLIFRQRYLFVNEELLSILYILYQAQQTHSSLYKRTRRKTLWNPDMYLEKVAMNSHIKHKSHNLFEGIYNFNSFKKIANTNAIFQRPQTEVPNNSEIAFIKRFIASNRFSRFSWTEDIFYQRNRLNENNQKNEELLTYGSILESYYYLIQFFMRNQHLFKEIKNKLLEKNILFKEDLQNIIYRNL